MRAYYQKNRESLLAKQKEYRDINLEKMRDRQREWRRQHPGRHNAQNAALYKKQTTEGRIIIAEHYGYCPYCDVTPPIDVMEIHHKNGGGNKDRRRGATFNFYRRIVTDGFPEDLEALCPTHHVMKHKGLIK